jgi:hypothetical protein
MAELTLNEDQTHGVVTEDLGVDAPPLSEQENPKTELGDGYHTTSATFGRVVSDYATDAAGHTPADIAQMGGAPETAVESDEDEDDDSKGKPGKGKTIGTEPIAERDMTGEPKPTSTTRSKK